MYTVLVGREELSCWDKLESEVAVWESLVWREVARISGARVTRVACVGNTSLG